MIVDKQISYNMEICDTQTRVRHPDTRACADRGYVELGLNFNPVL